jgi:hypothetical protein
MGKNKQQVATEARAKKTTPEVEPQPVAAVGPNPGQINGDTGKVNEQPKPNGKATPAAVAAATQPTVVSKQQLTIMRLTVAFREQRQIEVKPEMLTQDGKYINLLIGKEWPVIQIGASGGIVLPVIKSYPKAFEAALEGDKLLARQNEREAKKNATTAPAQPVTGKAITASAPPAPAPEVKAKAVA